MFRSIIEFRVRPREEDRFVAAFRDAGMLSRPRAIAGFVAASLARSLAEPTEFVVVGEWETEQAYADWQARSRVDAPAEGLARMQACLLDIRPGRLFSAIDAGSACCRPPNRIRDPS